MVGHRVRQLSHGGGYGVRPASTSYAPCWILLVVMASLPGCGGAVDSVAVIASGIGGGANPEIKDYSELDGPIAFSCEYSHGHLDPAALTELLNEHKGDLEAVSYVCERFCWPLYCWRKASQLNPSIREEICEDLIDELSGEYWMNRLSEEEHREFLEGHEAECLLGLPQLIY